MTRSTTYVSHNHGLTTSGLLLLYPTTDLHVDDFTATASSRVELGAGCDPAHPLITAAGAVVLDGGTADAFPECGPEPPVGTTFVLIRGASVTGEFDTRSDSRYLFSYTPTEVLLTRVS